MNITCNHCLATNRIPDNKDARQANCGKCKQPILAGKVINLSAQQFYPVVERNDVPVIVDFWASWCGPCQQMAPIFEQVASETDTMLFGKLNTETASEISADANIRSIPTIIFFFRGQEVDRISGLLNQMQLKQWIMQCVQKLSEIS